MEGVAGYSGLRVEPEEMKGLGRGVGGIKADVAAAGNSRIAMASVFGDILRRNVERGEDGAEGATGGVFADKLVPFAFP